MRRGSSICGWKGIDQEMLCTRSRAGRYGLPGMNERAKALRGALEVRSKMDGGTYVKLTIAASRAHLQSRSSTPLAVLEKRKLIKVSPDQNSIRILAVDDHLQFREGIAVVFALVLGVLLPVLPG